MRERGYLGLCPVGVVLIRFDLIIPQNDPVVPSFFFKYLPYLTLGPTAFFPMPFHPRDLVLFRDIRMLCACEERKRDRESEFLSCDKQILSRDHVQRWISAPPRVRAHSFVCGAFFLRECVCMCV